MAHYTDVLRSAVSKCKAADLESLLRQWGYLTTNELNQLNFSKSKACVFREVAKLCEEKNRKKETLERVNDFDLLCAVKYPTKRRWSMYELINKKAGTKESLMSDPVKFRMKLLKQIDLYFDSAASVSVTLHDGALCCRIYIQAGPNSKFMNSNTIYLIHYPHCQCIAISAFKVSIQNFLFQCLSNTLGYHTLGNMMLSGLHYKSLFQLAFKKIRDTSVGRLKEVQNLPFMSRHKRKAEEMEREPNMRSEDEAMKRKRSLSLEDAFGSYEQPVLESLQFKVDVKFRGNKTLPSLPDKVEQFRCCVKFEGPSVLEGIRNLAKCGLANEPLPKHLLRVNSLGMNKFVLKNKDKS